jgi:hypothetical protein
MSPALNKKAGYNVSRKLLFHFHPWEFWKWALVYYIGFVLSDAKNPARGSIIIIDSISAMSVIMDIANNCRLIY